MAGIYIHVPFCKQACNYCNFHFSTSLRYKDDLVAALVSEIRMQKNFFETGEIIDSIYFGGGTPSLLTTENCRQILGTIGETFEISNDREVTLEANPDDINNDQLNGWKATGINRLSIGIQSFFEEELRWMNRAHNANQAKIAILESQNAGFSNITIDLIYGSPLLTDGMWQENVETAINFRIPHLSCYALTVEEKTPLYKHISNNEKTDVSNEQQARQFLLLMHWLRNAGYEHYEVSNFAKPGFRSRHNSSYWKGIKYLGLGPSAHSYDGEGRSWNVSNNNIYIQAIRENRLPSEKEILTDSQKINEYLMISLRTIEGVDLQKLELLAGGRLTRIISQQLASFTRQGLIRQNNNFYSLTDEGMLRADGIASELFV